MCLLRAVVVTAICLLVLACAEGFQRVTIVGHRGNSQYAPENTLVALQQALELSDGFETDLRFSSDGQIVLIHDAWTNRTTNETWLVANHTLEELRTLDAGSWFGPQFAGASIPTLEEAVQLLVQYPSKIAVLDHKVESLAPAIAEIVNKYGVADRVIASCWTPTQLSDARQYLPDTSRQLLTKVVPQNTSSFFAEALGQGAAGWSALYTEITADFVRAAHRRLMSVVAWPVLNSSTVNELLDMGVDGLISDDPSGVKAAVGNYDAAQNTPSGISEDDSRTYVIAAIVGPVCAMVGVVLGFGAAVFYFRRRRQQTYTSISHP